MNSMTRHQGSRVLTLVCVLAWSSPGGTAQEPQQAEVLTNEAVVQMVIGKVPRDLVLAKIQSTRNTFDATAAGLVGLHQNRVLNETIKAVLRAATDSTSKDVLSNESVVYMVVNRLPRELILAKIQATRSKFDLTAGGLVGLTASKVHQEIVKAMMVAAAMPTTPAAATVAADNPPPTASKTAPTPPSPPPPSAGASALAPAPPPAKSPALPRAAAAPSAAPAPPARGSAVPDRPIGIYLEQGGVTPLQPTAFSMVNTGSVLKAAWTYGAARGSVKVVVKSPRATLRLSSAPSFLFYLNESALAGMSNPSEFVLARMKANRKERELVVGKGSAVGIGGSSGDVRAEDLVEMQVENVRAGVFRITPKTPFKAGEYCFYYPPGEGRLFDFGVD